MVYDKKRALRLLSASVRTASEVEKTASQSHADILPLLAPGFHSLHEDIVSNQHTYYLMGGGRGSTKSSCASLEIISGVMSDPNANAVVLRKVGRYLKDSVHAQLLWAIDALEVTDLWQERVSPLELVYKPTKQRIVFRGADEPRKIKSTKFKSGYCKFIWYEETDEFHGEDELRTINQSLIRGGDKFTVFYTYNPPRSKMCWINGMEPDSARLAHHSTYLDVPRPWLGEQFFLDAETLKVKKPERYRHEYLGIATGTGAEVFDNAVTREITDTELRALDRIYLGIDWGWYPDPFAFVAVSHNARDKKLYIFEELRRNRTPNAELARLLEKWKRTRITADSGGEGPKTIADFRSMGFDMRGARKGPGSVEYSMKWLASLEEIVIDPVRCPETAREFLRYEYERDRDGNVITGYPDADNHFIDAVRYSLENIWRRGGE